MNPLHEDDLPEMLPKLKSETSSSFLVTSHSPEIMEVSTPSLHRIYNFIGKLIAWFFSRSHIEKILILVILAFTGFAMLQAALKLIASVISLLLLATLVYLAYKFVVPNNIEQEY
ncbi:MAG: hypothetical protein AAF208_07735 [Cyanobacteria bacterium P01_A01_bin.45]